MIETILVIAAAIVIVFAIVEAFHRDHTRFY
jgi:hypothetical protein